MKSFVEEAVALISHKCFHDYCEAKKQDPNIGPEIFFDVWAKSFMLRVDEASKDIIWKTFLSKIVESRRAQ
jgi:hypothetical protein